MKLNIQKRRKTFSLSRNNSEKNLVSENRFSRITIVLPRYHRNLKMALG